MHILIFLMACEVFSVTAVHDGWCVVEINLESRLVKKCSNSVTQRLPKVAFLLLDLGFSLAFLDSCPFFRVVSSCCDCSVSNMISFP